MARTKRGADEPTIIKKYANRRLYDTGRSSYVTLDDLCEMVQEGHDFVVQDAKSGEDLTRSVLTQIIVDQESKEDSENLLPTNFLRQLIGFYGDNAQGFVPGYLEKSMEIFMKNQEQLQGQMQTMFPQMPNMMGGINGVPDAKALEEMNRKNMEMFEQTMNQTMKMFSNFGAAQTKSKD
ncbi:MAG: polyhydroxyalkanoate synthesis repressor PhaR [Alphaproteobacteria bacterium]